MLQRWSKRLPTRLPQEQERHASNLAHLLSAPDKGMLPKPASEQPRSLRREKLHRDGRARLIASTPQRNAALL